MLRIRLRRVGKKKRPAYRLVVADSRAPRDGAFVDIIGHYDPLTDPATLTIDAEKAREWLSKGAQPSETAVRLLSRQGLVAPPPLKAPPKAPPNAAEAPKVAAKKAPGHVAEAAPPEPPPEAAIESIKEEAPLAEVEAPAEPASEDAP